MTLERTQGLDVEVDHIVPQGWSKLPMVQGYTLTAQFSKEHVDDVWRIVRFLSYESMFVFQRTDSPDRREYRVLSCMESGQGFELVFLLKRG